MTSELGRAVLICNGSSKAKAVARALPEIQEHLRRRSLDHEIRLSRAPGHALRLARQALEDGHRFLVAVGGDGTVNEVVNGMMSDDRPLVTDAVLGVVAAGRACDFVRTFGIPAMPAHAVAHLDGADSFPIDLGKVSFVGEEGPRTRYFANIAEAGLGATVARTAARLPYWLGPTAYLLAFWAEVLRRRRAHVTVDLVDRTYEGPLDTLIVANGQFSRAGMKLAPRAAPTDGLLDVLIEAASPREAIALVPKAYRGEHLPHPDIRLAKRVRVSIEGPPLPLLADGEVLGYTPATFEVLPDAIRLKV